MKFIVSVLMHSQTQNSPMVLKVERHIAGSLSLIDRIETTSTFIFVGKRDRGWLSVHLVHLHF